MTSQRGVNWLRRIKDEREQTRGIYAGVGSYVHMEPFDNFRNVTIEI
jgi:hypothetical protein